MRRYANYPSDVTRLLGERFRAPRFCVGGGVIVVEWQITDVVYDGSKSHVEFEQVVPE